MIKNKRILAIWLAAALGITALSGCAGGGPDRSGGSDTESNTVQNQETQETEAAGDTSGCAD